MTGGIPEGKLEDTQPDWEGRYREEYRIVDRVWKALGITDYSSAGGREISQIVADWKARAEKAEAALASPPDTRPAGEAEPVVWTTEQAIRNMNADMPPRLLRVYPKPYRDPPGSTQGFSNDIPLYRHPPASDTEALVRAEREACAKIAEAETGLAPNEISPELLRAIVSLKTLLVEKAIISAVDITKRNIAATIRARKGEAG